jgi:hypothetical protein
MLKVIRAPRGFRVLLLMLLLMSASAANGQTTTFTYQGQLSDAGVLANGNYDLRFALFDSAAGGPQIGADQSVPAVPVTNGVFTVQLDFGVNAFPGADRFVEIGLHPVGGGSFTTLAPRQQISSSPYAIRTLSAATADALSSACVGCVTSAQIQGVAGSKVTGAIPVTSLPAGSGSYIQNSSTQQSGANFNVDGNGTIGGNLTVAGTLNANVSGNYIQNATAPQAGANFNISGNGTAGGTLAGSVVNAGTQYNLFGQRILSADLDNFNLSLGSGGNANTTGTRNHFFGIGAGMSNTSGFKNSFVGFNAGNSNTTGTANTFVGDGAGQASTGGQLNSFFGEGAGANNTLGSENSFFGESAGGSSTVGDRNSFFGQRAGAEVRAGSDNTAIGYGASVGNGLTNATAIGASALVEQSNSLVLGQSVNVGIGTTIPAQRLEVNGITSLGSAGSVYGYLVPNAGGGFGPYPTVGFNTYGTSYLAGVAGYGGILQFQDGDGSLTYYTGSNVAAGAAHATTPRFTINKDGDVGIGTTSPTQKLSVNGSISTSLSVIVGNLLSVNNLGTGGTVQLCRNSQLLISTCSSSLRYKQQIAPFSGGLELIRLLHPISFTWKSNGTRDLGLGAEDVAKVEPLLVTHNDKGEIEGVKYDHLNVVLINAIKEQQRQIEALQAANGALNARLQAVEKHAENSNGMNASVRRID